MTYSEKLEAAKEHYPFSRWRERYFPDKDEPDYPGMKQYTQENCDKAQAIFDRLIQGLIIVGQNADENKKIELFKSAVISFNQLDEEIEDLIETGEREDLCELIDYITIACGLDPKKYGQGEGIADEWRQW